MADHCFFAETLLSIWDTNFIVLARSHMQTLLTRPFICLRL